MITVIAKIIIAVLFSFFAALAASKSVLNESGENEKISWQAFLLTMTPGLVMLAISLIFPKATFPFLIVLAGLVILQVLNKRGGAQARCWFYLALIAAFMAWWGMAATNDAALAQATEAANQAAENIRATGGSAAEIAAAKTNKQVNYSYGFAHTIILLVILALMLIIGLANWIWHSKVSTSKLKADEWASEEAEKTLERERTIRAAASVFAAVAIVIVSIAWIAIGG